MVNRNEQSVVLASAARTATTTSPDQVNDRHRGIALLLDVTAVADTPNISAITVRAIVGDGTVNIYAFTALGIATTGRRAFLIHPGAADAGSWTGKVQGVIPRNWDVVVTHDDADSITYSLSVCYLK